MKIHSNVQIKSLTDTDTLLFGSTCKYVVLSSGSFSFFLGVFSFFSNVFYNNDAGLGVNKTRWHPNYFKEFIHKKNSIHITSKDDLNFKMNFKMTFKKWLSLPIPLKEILYQCSLDGKDKKEYKLPDDGLIPEPIGVGGKIQLWELSTMNKYILTKKINTNLSWYSFAAHTDQGNRSSGAVRKNKSLSRSVFIQTLIKNGFGQKTGNCGYMESLCLAKFAPSPEGNGIDCHRHWEALYCKSIPIVEDNELIKPKLEGLPVLYTHDYTELTPEYLNKKYEEILETEYDFSPLFLSQYPQDIQTRIKQRSAKWCPGWCKPNYYDFLINNSKNKNKNKNKSCMFIL